MKERPILFSTPMVQAILEGRKTMTRRIIKELDLMFYSEEWNLKSLIERLESTFAFFKCSDNLSSIEIKCPYGQIGDRLWVRETWGTYCEEWRDAAYFQYKASFTGQWDDIIVDPPKWKPSIFMPREASRILLEITNIRVERLQDITHGDAIAEGVDHVIDKITGYCGYDYISGGYNLMTSPYNGFCSLWKKINGPESWKLNPWVWVIEFKVINK